MHHRPPWTHESIGALDDFAFFTSLTALNLVSPGDRFDFCVGNV